MANPPISQIVLERFRAEFAPVWYIWNLTLKKVNGMDETPNASPELALEQFIRETIITTLDAAIAEAPDKEGVSFAEALDGDTSDYNRCRAEYIQKLSALKGRV